MIRNEPGVLLLREVTRPLISDLDNTSVESAIKSFYSLFYVCVKKRFFIVGSINERGYKMEKKMFNVKAMSYMAMFIALEIVLEYVDKMWPSMPQGGSLSTALIAIFLASYLMGPKYGMVVGVMTSLLQFILGLATYYGMVSAWMDYILALGVCGLASCIPSLRWGKQEFPLGIIVAMFVKFILHTVAGTVAF